MFKNNFFYWNVRILWKNFNHFVGMMTKIVVVIIGIHTQWKIQCTLSRIWTFLGRFSFCHAMKMFRLCCNCTLFRGNIPFIMKCFHFVKTFRLDEKLLIFKKTFFLFQNICNYFQHFFLFEKFLIFCSVLVDIKTTQLSTTFANF